MKGISVCLFVLLAILCSSCEDKRSYSEILREADSLVDTHPDSASVLLSAIIDPRELSAAEKADYGYLTALSHLSTGKAMAEDGLIIYTLGYYKDHNMTDKLATAYLLAAEYYKWVDEPPMRRTMLNAGLDLSLESSDSAMVFEFYHTIGADYYAKKEYREAIHFYRQAIAYKNNSQLHYEIGLGYAFIGKADSMDYFIKEAINIALKRNRHDAANHYRRNYADILFHGKKYREALNIQQQIAADEGSTRRVNLSAAQIYLALRQPDSAQMYVDSARIYLEEKKMSDPDLSDVSGENFIHALQAVLDYAKGNAINLQPMGQLNDSRRQEVREKELLIEEKINLKSRLEQQNLMLTISRQRMLLYIAWGLVAFVLIAIIVILYIHRKRRRLVEAEENREVLEKLLKEATAANEKDSSFFKKVLLQQLGLIKIVASTPTGHNQELLKQVSFINNNDAPTDSMLVWDDLYKLIDSIYDRFYSRLTSKYGEILTEKEKQLCCLLCAEFSTKEISVIIGQGVQTIYQRKTTIRQKLKMDEKEDIIEFIKM